MTKPPFVAVAVVVASAWPPAEEEEQEWPPAEDPFSDYHAYGLVTQHGHAFVLR